MKDKRIRNKRVKMVKKRKSSEEDSHNRVSYKNQEALFYDIINEEKKIVQCHLCPWNCVIKNNGWGVCGARKNINGRLYSMTYGRPVAVHVDPIEKKPLYHFLPGERVFSISTFGCNLFCLNCQNYDLSRTRADKAEELGIGFVEPEEVVNAAIDSKARIIAYTYNEPTVFYEYTLDIMKLARKNKIRNVWVSNGYINEEPLKKLLKYLDGINVDLKFFNEEKYREVTKGSLAPVLKTLKIINDKVSDGSVWLEIKNLIIPGFNDAETEIKKMVDWISKNLGNDVPLHFSRFFPMYKMNNVEPTPMRTLIRAYEIAREKLNFVYVGNIPPSNDFDNTYCPKCGEELIVRYGFHIVKYNLSKDKTCPKGVKDAILGSIRRS